mgnify:CR=1 FL=1
MKKSTFCILPFHQFMIDTHGRAEVCCAISEEFLPNSSEDCLDVNKRSIKEIWNSDFYKSLRMQLLNNEKPLVCSRCWYEEDQGRKSVREATKNDAGFDCTIDLDKCKENNGYLDSKPKSLDIRLGNLCNLKCRMCNSAQSSQIQKENKVLIELHGKQIFDKDTLDEQDPFVLVNESQFDWVDKESFWKEVKTFLTDVGRIYFVGGEPTLHEKHYQYLERLVSNGKAKDIELWYNTNITNVQDRFINLTNQFKILELRASLDGVDKLNDYIRYPSDWKTLVRNIRKLHQECRNVKIIFDFTIQALNGLRFLDFIEWVIDYNYNYCHQESDSLFFDSACCFPHVSYLPKHTSLFILPLEVRKNYLNVSKERIKTIEKHLKILDERSSWSSSDFRDTFQYYINAMNDPLEYKENERKNFIKYSLVLDKHRSQNLFDVLPEYKELFGKYIK